MLDRRLQKKQQLAWPFEKNRGQYLLPVLRLVLLSENRNFGKLISIYLTAPQYLDFSDEISGDTNEFEYFFML